MQHVFNLARAVPEANLIAAHTIGGCNSQANILAGETFFADGAANVCFEVSDFSRRDYVRAAYERLGAEATVDALVREAFHQGPAAAEG